MDGRRWSAGRRSVTIDRDFAAVVDPADYHVFLTGYDGATDLSVYDRTPQGFRVRAKSGNGESTFSWRVVAKRKDIAAPRFETVEIPKEPTLPSVPASATACSSAPARASGLGLGPRGNYSGQCQSSRSTVRRSSSPTVNGVAFLLRRSKKAGPGFGGILKLLRSIAIAYTVPPPGHPR